MLSKKLAVIDKLRCVACGVCEIKNIKGEFHYEICM